MKAELTQSKLAEESGMSQAMVARVEHGDVDPCLSTVRDLAEVLNRHQE